MRKTFQDILNNDIDSKKAIQYLFDMIKINSVTGNEGEMGEYIACKLESYGMNVKKQEISPGRFNVVTRIKGRQPGPRILLSGHIDTVPPTEGWDTDPFEPVIKDGKIYGLGSCDMKAGIAVILTAAEILNSIKDCLPGEVIIAFVVDEEAYSEGIKKLIEEGIEADFGLMAEPHFDPIIIGCPGKILIKGIVQGVATHGATPHLGINAIEEASKILANLDSIEVTKHEKLGMQPYVTLKIEGGYKEYSITVPDRCEFTINKHTVPGEDEEKVLQDLVELTEKLGLNAKVEFTIEPPYYPPYLVREDSEFLKKLSKCYKSVTSRDLILGYGDGVSDVNYLVTFAHIPTVCLGPSGKNLHSINEWVSAEEIDKVLKIYLKFILNLCE